MPLPTQNEIKATDAAVSALFKALSRNYKALLALEEIHQEELKLVQPATEALRSIEELAGNTNRSAFDGRKVYEALTRASKDGERNAKQ